MFIINEERTVHAMVDVRLSVVFGVVALIALGLADFIRKKAMTGMGWQPMSYFLTETFFLLFITMAITFSLEKKVAIPSFSFLAYALASSTLVGIGIASLLMGLRIGEVSTVVPIARLSLLLTAILGLTLLNEQITPTKILGIILGILAIILLSR